MFRNVLSAIGDPLKRMRHEAELRRGRITPEEQAHADASWWGDDKRWYPAGYEPRKHCTVTPLIDGEQYFKAVESAMNEAERYIFISAWILSPYFPLSHANTENPTPGAGMSDHPASNLERSQLINILAEATKRGVVIRILIWSGARLTFQPTQKMLDQMIASLKLQSPNADILALFDHGAKFTHTIHEKSLSIDGKIGFVSGMDFTTLEGDRWDTPAHPFRRGQNWHDGGFQLEELEAPEDSADDVLAEVQP